MSQVRDECMNNDLSLFEATMTEQKARAVHPQPEPRLRPELVNPRASTGPIEPVGIVLYLAGRPAPGGCRCVLVIPHSSQRLRARLPIACFRRPVGIACQGPLKALGRL